MSMMVLIGVGNMAEIELTPEFNEMKERVQKEIEEESHLSAEQVLELQEYRLKFKTAVRQQSPEETLIIHEKPFKSSSDIGEGFENLDNNSHLDMNSRLSGVEISACTIIDQLKTMGVFPEQATITQQFKRLKVSEGGKGRTEKVQIVTGHREQNKPSGFFDLFKKRAKELDTTEQPGGN